MRPLGYIGRVEECGVWVEQVEGEGHGAIYERNANVQCGCTNSDIAEDTPKLEVFPASCVIGDRLRQRHAA
jgi:hypothetical protein